MCSFEKFGRTPSEAAMSEPRVAPLCILCRLLVLWLVQGRLCLMPLRRGIPRAFAPRILRAASRLERG